MSPFLKSTKFEPPVITLFKSAGTGLPLNFHLYDIPSRGEEIFLKILVFILFLFHRLISAYNDKIKGNHQKVAPEVISRYGVNVTFAQFIEFIVTESRVKCRYIV